MGRECQTKMLNKFNIKNANYEVLNQSLTEKVLALQNLNSNTPEEAELLVKAYQNSLTITCEDHIPKIKISDKYTPWWNPELTRTRKDMATLRRKAQNCCPCRAKLVYLGQFRRKRLEYKHKIREAKKSSWRKFVKDVSNENPYCLPYKLTADKISKKEVLSSLRRGQNFTRTAMETMDLLLNTLIPLDDPQQEGEHHLNVRDQNSGPISQNIEPPISMTELEIALKTRNLKKLRDQTAFPRNYLKISMNSTEGLF